MDERQRLDAAIKRRDRVQQDVNRIKGRLEAARAEVAKVEAECRQKGVDPDKLDATIEQLNAKYNSAVADLEAKIAKAEADIAPFLGEDRA